MKTASVSELKARLSEHLREVRRGRPLTVTDRRQPVAVIVPIADSPAGVLELRRPVASAGEPGRVKMPPPLRLKVDAVASLLEDRAARR